ncbi:hypothetical protein NMW28_27410, partial [Escherichia coli]|uniref:hypothetical protein n=1 Tax=Escherichia coli TaxID=562 RepID=UPI002246FA46
DLATGFSLIRLIYDILISKIYLAGVAIWGVYSHHIYYQNAVTLPPYPDKTHHLHETDFTLFLPAKYQILNSNNIYCVI